ncbi:HAD-IA family hydrolase [Rummeliibacillus suwonensis]|uniref:HAD-IA family hydrolase n=1 Tax=Rummeliibacillus suwonensis TaxID=1306154 RepID=UPI0035E3F3B0
MKKTPTDGVSLYNLSKKYKLFIVSNCQQGYIEGFFQYHKLKNYFLDYEIPSRTGFAKGDNIKLIIERNKLSKPVYVGDTEGDLKASGMQVSLLFTPSTVLET